MLLVLFMSLVGDAGVYRASLFAFGCLVGAHALSASFRVDNIDFLAFGDCLARAFRLAGAATDALIGNLIGHVSSS
jgi:hypothetical protein